MTPEQEDDTIGIILLLITALILALLVTPLLAIAWYLRCLVKIACQ